MKFLLTYLLISATAFMPVPKPKEITWADLADVTWERRYDAELEETVKVPVFSDKIQKLKDKEVQIQGFMLPVDVHTDYYVLSKNPYNTCFFCGKAGRETVMELKMAKEYSGLRMDQYVTVKGILRLNSDDIYQLNYILDNVEIVAID